tara:strand:+ start:7087 stop:8382 length:1296 start_codon:yes stop_codon:yes gene_type:complete
LSAHNHIVVAIDGPAASGKSSVAKILAREFGFTFVNSGAMYRAMTWHTLEQGIDPADSEAVIRLLHETNFTCGVRDGASTVAVNGRELNDELREQRVNDAVSAVSAIPEVRVRLVDEQRRYQELTDVITEGRDIGTVVFPDTPYKFYLDASPEVRAKRRGAEGVTDDIRLRDRQDSNRKTAPLRPAPDAEMLDSSHMTLEEVASHISLHLRTRGIRRDRTRKQQPKCSFLYRALKFSARWIYTALYRFQIHYPERAEIPGGALIASNHISFFDPPIVGCWMNEPIHYMARKTLFSTPAADWVYRELNSIPVDQEQADMSTFRTVIGLVKKGEKVLIFPEGERTSDGNLGKGQRGVGMLIGKSHAPVIPMRIFGSFEIFPRGAKFPRPHGKLDLVVGEPIYFTDEELNAKGKKASQYLADKVMEEIGKLKIP